MPTYSHRCARCGLVVDLRCAIDDRDAPKPCAELITDAMRKAPPGLVINGVKSKTSNVDEVLALQKENPYTRCDGQGTFTRPEGELDRTAFTPYSWGRDG
jgi:hypothetical protein